ncbi:LysR family transcriptional regulator [Rhodococcus sp. NPDC127530]|uniref:LysR substrate-binding domain-containing protein n=1 Tax=unclassified Rhodococcus (in: high G+C Gram-positive bacteria) TaxID=192944 RepID=UPI00362F1B49
MEFRQLRYFLAVGEEGSFSRAAQRCFISQSAISHQIAKLEHELGTTLLERSTRATRLTAAGERLMPIAAEMMGLEARALSVGLDPRNRLRISASMSFATQSLEAISAVREDFPQLDIEFVIKDFTDRMTAVASGDADLALIRGGVDRPGLETVEFGLEDLVIVTSSKHPLAGVSTVDLSELAPYPLLLPPRSSQILIHTVVEDAFRQVGQRVMLGPSIPSDHTATLDVLTTPRSWTVLYADTADATPRRGLSFLREAHDRLRIPVCGVVRSGTATRPELTHLFRALAQSIAGSRGSADT